MLVFSCYSVIWSGLVIISVWINPSQSGMQVTSTSKQVFSLGNSVGHLLRDTNMHALTASSSDLQKKRIISSHLGDLDSDILFQRPDFMGFKYTGLQKTSHLALLPARWLAQEVDRTVLWSCLGSDPPSLATSQWFRFWAPKPALTPKSSSSGSATPLFCDHLPTQGSIQNLLGNVANCWDLQVVETSTVGPSVAHVHVAQAPWSL